MWRLVGVELEIPWRTAEAMHWMMGPIEMARRANTKPFSLAGNPLGTMKEGDVGEVGVYPGAYVDYDSDEEDTASLSGAHGPPHR